MITGHLLNNHYPIKDFLSLRLSENHSQLTKLTGVVTLVAFAVFSLGIGLFAWNYFFRSQAKKLDVPAEANEAASKHLFQAESAKATQNCPFPKEKIPEREITKHELSQHNKREDIWVAVHGLVFNLTPFLDDHPGGEDVLVYKAGTDATQTFYDMGHSPEAHQLAMRIALDVWLKYLV